MVFRVILVHGTFSENPEWTHGDSLLSRNLAMLSESGECPTPFSWSGRNSARARHIAAMELRQMLEEYVRVSPDSYFLIIGHSHGGNIGMRAIDCELLRERSSIACLSTPFLEVIPREIPLLAYTQLTFALALCVVSALTYLIAKSAVAFHLLSVFSHFPTIVYFYAYVFAAFLAFMLLDTLKTRLAFKALEIADIFQHKPEIHSDNVQLLRTTGDEASMVIGIAQILSWLSSKCSAAYVLTVRSLSDDLETASSWLQDQAGNYSATVGKAVISLLLTWVVIEVLGERFPKLEFLHWIPILFSAVGVIFLFLYKNPLKLDDPTGWISIVLSPVLLTLIPISIAFAIFGVLGFGVGTGVLSLFFELSVEAAPQGTWKVVVFRPLRGNTLRHSQLYNNSLAVEHLCKWAQEKMHQRRRDCDS